ncbi:MAG TPA: hypothetical protein VLH38_04915 [Patescibacteria group bacterium]|nr:hypothetical protein [Patescibacteria group bacterium]
MSEKQSKNPEHRPTTSRKWAGRISLFLAGAAVGSGVIVGIYSETSPTEIAGEVICPAGEPVSGVWVEPNNPIDREWANWQPNSNRQNAATFTASLAHSSSYALGVGCGGTPEKWEHNDASPAIAVKVELIAVSCTDTIGIKAGSCTVAPLLK